MSTPILTTKLYIPSVRPHAVLRPRLIGRINEGLHRRLTLISAPAGFGKTSLVSQWLAGGERPAAWLSLDDGDNEPTRFFAYVVAALQNVAPNIGDVILGALQSFQSPTEHHLTTLLNEIATAPAPFVLVLDDYHVIDAGPVDDALTFLIDHLPPRMHLLIATREDPHLPLARLRARGELTELRAADLRFTLEEATEFLKGVMGLDLSAEAIAALETRTEGWIAGLQMAALSMRGRADVASFIESFAGSHRFVLDYLAEEVLRRQPDRIRGFLLTTSILDRLSGSLCDAVTGVEGGRGMLETLERGNLFVVPLDDERRWYRYHQLFATVLQAILMEEQPNRAPALHRRAGEWYERHGLPAEAIHHAFAAEDFARAADLVEVIWPAMDRNFRTAEWLDWAKALPDEVVRVRPVLSVAYARALLDGGELDAAATRLRDAERWLTTTADLNEGSDERSDVPSPEMSVVGMVVADEEQFRSLPALIATGRAAHAQAIGDLSGAVTYARRGLDLLPEGSHYERGVLAALLGVAYWASGDLEAAHGSFAEFQAQIRSILIDNAQPLIDAGVLSDQKVAEIKSHEYSTGPDAEGLTPQFFFELYKQAEPFIAGSVDLLAVAEVTRRIVASIRNWHREKQEEADLQSEPVGDVAADSIAEPYIVLTMPTLIAVCYEDLVRRHGRTGSVAVEVHPRSHWMGYGLATHPEGAETYTIRLTVRDSSYFYMIDGVGTVFEHFRTEGEYFKLLAIPDLLSSGARRSYYGRAEAVRTLQIGQPLSQSSPA